MTFKLSIGNKKYTIESAGSGFILRQNGLIAADYTKERWVWTNAKLDIPESDLEKIKGVISG